ncbi:MULTISPECIES: helix-turn-helix domain-containing protein [unclassified Paenibacillus]|uniref:helix-turn-helix domain-containing protein n=1 Tax=unclassified Paenibacillus TaxID=185978 RepID=UPI002406A506|nr:MULTISPECIES: helix-turn-helix domain-containing protein [unclassified Paenibacillus]MDF9843807.1 hypothetical protein [Paenibacillus sp. PastF-2]MDF9850354.1 hypothetical protein [Paenibacillus sp. PastM-2]MDF9856943.1 hypothetical protein [Paenibacillus sp. PastF-1]MDH6482200.1 hypothetical protein [Paenibacillus sp. PastH-2]MDH6509636.1 hypothetical protein [Paenibacillus sp. PastM-3]
MEIVHDNNSETKQREAFKPTYFKGSYSDEAWLNRSEDNASDYMRKIADNGAYANFNKFYVQLPHKLYRCLGLTIYEKMILTELVAYMGANSRCFPTQETIALNIGASSKTVSDHLWSLSEKDFIWVDYRNHNNLYFLAANLQDNPYVVLSELTHQFIREKRNFEKLNEKLLLASVKKFIDGGKYAEYATEIQRTYMNSAESGDYSDEPEKVKEIVKRFKKHLETLVK